MEINRIVTDSIEKLDLKKIIQDQVSETVTETVKSEIENIFRSYSDFGKELRSTMKEELKVDFSRLGIKDYNCMIVEIIKSELQKNIKTEAAEHIKALVKKALQIDGKTKYKLSELIEEFAKEIAEDENDLNEWGDDFYFFVEDRSSGYKWISIGKEDQCEYTSEFRFLLDQDNKISHLSIKEVGKGIEKEFFLNNLSKFAATLFKIQLNGFELECDTNYCDINISQYSKYEY